VAYKGFSSFHAANNQGGLHFLFLYFIKRYRLRSVLSLSLATFCRPNSSFAFDFLQHHVHIRHRRYYDKQKAVVVVEASLMLGLPITRKRKGTQTSRMHLRGIGNRVWDISMMLFRRRHFGDGTFRRWWSP